MSDPSHHEIAPRQKGNTLHLKTVTLGSHYDYIIIGCGYVERLTGTIEKIKKEEKEANYGAHSFVGLLQNNNLGLRKDLNGLQDAITAAAEKLGGFNSSVCLKGDGDIGFIVDELRKARHCACWGEKPSKVASFKTRSGKTVLYEEYDTESG